MQVEQLLEEIYIWFWTNIDKSFLWGYHYIGRAA